MSSYWNYRVFRKAYIDTSGETSYYYQIHEVYYNGKTLDITRISVEPVVPQGDTPDELRRDLEFMSRAFEKPILDHDYMIEVLNDKVEDSSSKQQNTREETL